MLVAYEAVVVVLAVTVGLLVHTSDDGDFGAGAILLVLLVVGLPWSLNVFFLLVENDSGLATALQFGLPAMLNGLLVLVGARLVRRRRRPEH